MLPFEINHRDLPVLGKPRQVQAMVITTLKRWDAEPVGEEHLSLTYRQIVVIDFYRGRTEVR